MATDKSRVDTSAQWIDIALRYRPTPFQCRDILTASFRLEAAMSNERRARLWGLVVEQGHGEPVAIAHVGAAASVDGAAVTVMLSATPRETVYASDPTAVELEELTLTLGEGPGVDAVTDGPALAEI
jgi:hypothetical protein